MGIASGIIGKAKKKLLPKKPKDTPAKAEADRKAAAARAAGHR